MFKNAKRFETKLNSIPFLNGIDYVICLTSIPERKIVPSNPDSDGKTFDLVRWNDVKLVDWTLESKKEVSQNQLNLLSAIEKESILNLDISKDMSNKLMDFVDNSEIGLNQNFGIRKIKDSANRQKGFENTIEPFVLDS